MAIGGVLIVAGFIGVVLVAVPSVLVPLSSIVTLPRSSPHAATPADAPAPSAAATSRIPAFRSTGVRVA